MLQPTPKHIAELDRLGDEIALLSAHLGVVGTIAQSTKRVYRIDRDSNGEFEFRRPDGQPLPQVPPAPPLPTDPVLALKMRHEEQGLRLHARTTLPGWLGERLDVGWAIDVLHPLAKRRSWPPT
jgi:hypothetical protein